MEWKQREIIIDRYIPDDMGDYSRLSNIARIKHQEGFIVQYTGVDDINGQKIFEGDIVKHEDQSGIIVGVVIFKNLSFMWQTSWLGNSCLFLKNCKKPEILGNVFQNPVLVKKYKLEEN